MRHRKIHMSQWLALALALIAAPAPAQEEPAGSTRALTGLDVATLEDDRIRITLSLTEVAPEPVVFTVDKPARLSLDLADTRLGLEQRFRRVGAGRVRSIAAAEAQGRSRVVVELAELAPYTVRTENNQVIVEIQGRAVNTLAAQPAATAALPAQIVNLDFRRGENGEGRVVIQLGDPRTTVDVKEDKGRVLAQFRNTSIPDSLLKRLDVLDFATPVKYVDVMRDGRNTNVYLTPVTGAEFEQVAYQAQNLFTLELQPLVKEELDAETKRKEQVFTGERISLSFQNIDVRSLLQIIGDVSGNNVVISDGVTGELAMRLVNVPWDQALDIILRTKGLGLQQQGNVMLIAPLDEIAARAKAEGEATKQKDEGAPLRSEIIQINYAKAADLAALLKGANNTLLSSRGQVSVDERTNTMLVLETRERLSEIRDLIQQLDVPIRQVLIESRIVIANDDFTKSLGTRFGITAVSGNGPGGLITTTGSNAGTDTTVGDFVNNNTLTLPALNDRFNVNLPVTGQAGRIGLAVLGSDYLVDLELSALQAEGQGEVKSTPRVVTVNAKQASIRQGVDIPYREASSSGAATITFKEAVLLLNVTPQITPDNRIIMDLQVKNDARGADVPIGDGFGTVPSIDRREVNTQVLVENGETVVLGGVFQETRSASVNKVPLLGDIPLLGYLFRSTTNINNKRELLIFITPKILDEGMRIN